MKKVLAVSVAVMLVMLFSASVLLAQEKVVVEKEKGSCQKEMKLTEEQKAKMEELRTESRMQAIDLRAEREKLALTFKKEWMKPEPNAQTLEGLVKQMSAVREKLQINRIQHMLAMRKLLGPDWKMFMKARAGERCDMMGDMGMPGAGGDECCPMMGGMMAPMAGAGGCPGMVEKRIVRVVREGEGAERGCMMEMQGMGAGRGMGAMKGSCKMQQGDKNCCSSRASKWRGKMFRPYGKKGCCSSQGSGMMGQQGMGAGCGMGAMKGGCMMHQGGGCKGSMKGGCMGAASKKTEGMKEGTCPLEMKKEKETEKKK
jgi:Spy/CpxP family protein refolding chaperone